jgi:hypothetical protein
VNEPKSEPDLMPEPTSVTILCPECSEIVSVKDIHALLLGLHQRVCVELTAVNGAPD